MPAVWYALKKSLDCKTAPSEVHDPTKNVNPTRSGCSISISNLRDVIHSSKRHTDGLGGGSSPKSIGSSQVILNGSTCELQITGFGPGAKKGATSGSRAHSNCQNCGKQLKDLEAFELHHLSMHSVTELAEGDSSRKIVELICGYRHIERVLKVHNMAKTVSQFEEYREMVKMRGSKLAKKHPRCVADGNEVLGFYGTVVACSLGSCGLCKLERCDVCNILRHGFSSSGVGVYTTSVRALESVEASGGGVGRALIVCRVIAGRVHRPLGNHKQVTNPSGSGFDSFLGRYSNMEELYLLNPKALLPRFLILCKHLHL